MGMYDNVGDVPGQLQQENLQIVLQFLPGDPAATQATVSWNIPIPDNSSGTTAYAGIVIVVSDKPVAIQNIPKDGVTYVADPTFDLDLFSGDRIGGARVLASIYEPQAKQTGDFTTSVIINNYDATKNYYICGYALDAQRRYDKAGIRAYSDRLGQANQPGGPANQTILMAFNPNSFTSGVLPTDGTNLIAGATYQFQVIYDSGYPYSRRNTVRNMLITIRGEEAGTYKDLLFQINKQMAIQCNPGTIISPITPGMGIYYWNGTQLYYWNGTELILVTGVIEEQTAPSSPAIGSYWYNTINMFLYQYNGTTWVQVPGFVSTSTTPTNPTTGEFWYDPTTGLLQQWNGTSWVTISNVVAQSTQPTGPALDSYWYNPLTGVLSQWNGTAWVAVPNSVVSPTQPTNPTTNEYWFNPTTGILEQWNGTAWVPVVTASEVIVQATDPTDVAVGTYWYNPTTGVLAEWNGTAWVPQTYITSTTNPANLNPTPTTTTTTTTETYWFDGTNGFYLCGDTWCESPTIISPTDPSCPILQPATCAYWYESPVEFQQWNGTTWVTITDFIVQPSASVNPTTGEYWYDPTTGQLQQWNGLAWILVTNFVSQPNAPTSPTTGEFWYSSETGVLQQWNGLAWIVQNNFIVAQSAPVAPTVGEYWYNSSNNILSQWNGFSWVTITNFVAQTTQPTSPALGEYWYNSTPSTLYSWSGAEPWQEAYAITWPVAPNALTTGTYWYDMTNSILFQRTATPGTQAVNFSAAITDSTPITATGTGIANITVNGLTTINVSINLTQTPTIGALITALNVQLGSTASAALNVTGTAIVITSSTLTPTSSISIVDTNLFAQLPSYNSLGTPVAGTGSWTSEVFVSSTTDPSLISADGVVAGTLWYNPTTEMLSVRNITNTAWTSLTVLVWPTDPTDVTTCELWFDSNTDILYIWNILNQTWDVATPFYNQVIDPFLGVTFPTGTLWYNPTTGLLYVWNGSSWTEVTYINYPTPPSVPTCPSYWYDTTTMVLSIWNGVTWSQVSNVVTQTTAPVTPTTGQYWLNPTTQILSVWNGTAWVTAPNLTVESTAPTGTPSNATIWYNPTTATWSIWCEPIPGQWNVFNPTISTSNPGSLAVGTFWFDTTNDTLYQWDGTMWVEVPFGTTAPSIKRGQTWYNTSNNKLYRWNGTEWILIRPCAYARFDPQGNIVFETTGTGSNHVIMIPVPNGVPYMASGVVTYGTGAADYINDSNSPYNNYPLGGIGNVGFSPFDIPQDLFGGLYYDGLFTGLDYFGDFSGYGLYGGATYCGPDCWVDYGGEGGARVPYAAIPISPQAFLWARLKPIANVLLPYGGVDGVSGTPTYNELGVGTDGSPDERRNIMRIVRNQLGYPTVTVELTDAQIDVCVQNALETFRQRSSMSVYRTCFFLDIQPFNQHYVLSNKAVGFNKVVDVMAGYRFTSAFLSSAMGAGVYGQVVLQHLYNMGTFDLLSYHIVSQYVEQLEIMFATRLTFVWDANTRKLSFHQSFTRPERILLDVTLEKTEQEIFLDRYAKRWIQQFALAEAMDILAQIRGKYASLPGASGNVTLNALDLRTQAKDIRDMLYTELDDNIVQDVESYGAYGSFTMG
jgi:hypothetical protein